MTLSDIRSQVYANLGNPTDLNPSTDTSYNGGPMLTWVANEAQRQLAFWKDPQMSRQLRFRNLISDVYFTSKLITGTLTSTGTTTTVVFPSANVGSNDDRYNGWVVEVDNEMRLIVDYTGSTYTATVHKAFSSAPASGDTYKLMKRFSLLLPSTHAWVSSPSGEHITLPSTTDRYRADGNLYEVLKIEDIDNTRVLDKAERTESYPDYINTSGDPTCWWRLGNKVYFDTNIDATNYYRMEYYRLPTDMSASTDEPEIPEVFHYGLVLWGTQWGYRRKQESSDTYSVGRELVDFMRQRASQYDVESERETNYMTLRVK